MSHPADDPPEMPEACPWCGFSKQSGLVTAANVSRPFHDCRRSLGDAVRALQRVAAQTSHDLLTGGPRFGGD
jgi:hypothetical protein